MATIMPCNLPASSGWNTDAGHHRWSVTRDEHRICVCNGYRRGITIYPAGGNDHPRLQLLSPIEALSPKDQFRAIAAVFVYVPNTICCKHRPQGVGSVPKHVIRNGE